MTERNRFETTVSTIHVVQMQNNAAIGTQIVIIALKNFDMHSLESHHVSKTSQNNAHGSLAAAM